MLDNLLTLLDEENFINKFGYGKEFDKIARDNTYQFLSLLQFDLLPSSYFGDDFSNNYSIVLKGVSEEAARFYLLSLYVQEDLYFENTRSDYIFQNIGSYVGLVAERLFQLGLDHQTFKEFLIAITKAYFGGATKASMEAALAIYPGPIHNYLNPSQITYLTLQEIYLDLVKAGVNPDIALQWSFYLNIEHPEYISDINAFTSDVKFFVEIIKPAHTLSVINFIYPEPDDGGTITQNMNDKHREELFFYAYEDFRHDCYSSQIPIISFKENITSNFMLPEQGILNHRPIVNSSGGLASIGDVTIETELGDILTLTELNAYTGEFTLVSGSVPVGQLIYATYFHQIGKSFTAVTNHSDLLTNQGFNEVWDNRNPYQSVTNTPEPNPIPLTINYKWRAFELPNSALFNEVRNLVLNGDKHIGNQLNLCQNTSSKGYKYNQYNVTLNEGTPIYPLTQARTRYNPNPYPMGLILNEPEDLTNNIDDFLFTRTNPPTTIVRDISKLDDVYAAMEVDRTINNGMSGILNPICDNSYVMQLGYAEYIESIKPDRDIQPAYLNTMTFLNRATLNGENPVLVINIEQSDSTSDSFVTPLSDQDYMQLSGFVSDNLYPSRISANFMLNFAGGARSGDSEIYVYDTSEFPSVGTLLINSGVNFEIVTYSSKTPTKFNLDTPLIYNHASNELITLYQFTVTTNFAGANIGDTVLHAYNTASTSGFLLIGSPSASNFEIISYSSAATDLFNLDSSLVYNHSGNEIIINQTSSTTTSTNFIGSQAGSSILSAYNTSSFPATGTLLIGSADSMNFEIVSYSSKSSTQFNLTAPLVYDHIGNEIIILANNYTYSPTTSLVGSSEENQTSVEDLLFDGGLKIYDDWIQLDFSNPVATYWLDGNGLLRNTPLHIP